MVCEYRADKSLADTKMAWDALQRAKIQKEKNQEYFVQKEKMQRRAIGLWSVVIGEILMSLWLMGVSFEVRMSFDKAAEA